MEKSSGLLIIKNNKVLLGHPTNASWFGRHSIPKGRLEEGEDELDAAIRETQEEVGITIKKEEINTEQHFIEYKDGNGKIYKVVYYYIVNVTDYPDILPKEQLQIEEIDWAGFMTYEEASTRMFWRLKPMLDFIK